MKIFFIITSYIYTNFLHLVFSFYKKETAQIVIKLTNKYPGKYFHFYNDWYVTDKDVFVAFTIDHVYDFRSILYSRSPDTLPFFLFAFFIDYNRLRKL